MRKTQDDLKASKRMSRPDCFSYLLITYKGSSSHARKRSQNVKLRNKRNQWLSSVKVSKLKRVICSD